MFNNKKKVKIGIVTLPLHINFGGFLQNYALQQVLLKMGYEPITLNQRPIPRSARSQLIANAKSNLKTLALTLLGRKGDRTYAHYHGTELRPVLWKNSTYFYDTYIRHTESLNPNVDFEGISQRLNLGALIVGSDQVWRPRYVENLNTMYLGFEKDRNVRKIAYAASIGTDDWEYTKEQTSECSVLASQFDLLTVREKSTVDNVKQHLGVKADFALDPTLLLDKEDYIKIVEEQKEPVSEGNLFCYILDIDNNKKRVIKEVEQSLGLKSFNVNIGENTTPYKESYILKNLSRFQNPTITKWLRGFMDAEMVIADSFHAVAFSIIFNKPFWVIGNKGRGMARFESILSLFNLTNRLLDANNLTDVDWKAPIDWTFVNVERKSLAEHSLTLLLNSLK